ncbi:sigma 54-interacting transcriptional regulator, partial [Desulfosarcina sp. OttesenSCG-928-G10]|nr:sigma 54-interacting transcriptional regulator [Desulfosarcina sp. OttesenSCG-928-G10]
MRLILSAPQVKALLRLPQKPSEWPLTLRFVMLVIPAGICVALASLWIGHKAASVALMQSIEALPLLEAKTQAKMMTDLLSDMRSILSRIAQSDVMDMATFHGRLETGFHEPFDLVQEITVQKEDGSGYMLLRDNGGFASLSITDASLGPNSPLQQVATSPLYENRATLYPPVFFGDLASSRHSREHRTPVMRMAVPLSDGSGTVILGINFAGLRHRLSTTLRPDAPLRLPQQEGAVQLAFFFDVRGWVLFEMDNTATDAYLPDIARQGYTGDLGRAGYEAAFRPGATHENFWRMVTEVAAGHAGSIPSPANLHPTGHVGSSGMLCFAPVLFTPAAGQPAQPIGGIAFFETSPLPLATFLRLANYSLVIAVGALLLFGLLSWKWYRTVVRPFRQMREELETLSRAPVPDFVKSPVGCEEQEQLKSAVNRIIAAAIRVHGDLDYLSREIHQSRSRQPVDLSLAVPERSPADYDLLGSGVLIRDVREHVRKAAQAGTDVLVWGETGTGKELVAAAIHRASARAAGPYISINCGALDENLLLDTLFGHMKGAFTEARTDRKGAFLAAEGGTLHLDEIANASLKVQQALLRALSVRRIRPLGTDAEIPFDTRIVAATNMDLRECVRAGTFREDLYYRLAIISIETPPLRHRKEDIPELAAFFIDDAAKALGRPPA